MLFCKNVNMQLKFIYLFIYLFLPPPTGHWRPLTGELLLLPQTTATAGANPRSCCHRWDRQCEGREARGIEPQRHSPTTQIKSVVIFCRLFPFFPYPRFMFLIKFKFNSLIAVSVRGCGYLLKLIILTFYLEAHNSLSFKHVISKCCA